MTITVDGGPDDGFALVAALGAVMLFAFFAYAVLAADQGAIASLHGQLQRARLEAAAEAGLATAVEGLGAPPGRRWAIDGRRRTFTVDGFQITAIVEDERGKVALNGIKPDQARRLFQGAGISGARLDQLTDTLLNWEDSGGDRPNGASSLDYAARDILPRGGPIRTLAELMALQGMDAGTVDRIAPSLTLFFGVEGVFDPTTASPAAIAVMAPGGGSGPDSLIRAREQAGQRPVLASDPALSYLGRPFTVRIEARDDAGGVYRRATIVELTGRASRPFWIRAIDD